MTTKQENGASAVAAPKYTIAELIAAWILECCLIDTTKGTSRNKFERLKDLFSAYGYAVSLVRVIGNELASKPGVTLSGGSFIAPNDFLDRLRKDAGDNGILIRQLVNACENSLVKTKANKKSKERAPEVALHEHPSGREFIVARGKTLQAIKAKLPKGTLSYRAYLLPVGVSAQSVLDSEAPAPAAEAPALEDEALSVNAGEDEAKATTVPVKAPAKKAPPKKAPAKKKK
jgi:hypothetical protein